MPYLNFVFQYFDLITFGKIVAGKWVLLVYKMIVDGLKSGEYKFDADKASRAIDFIENFCHHSEGRQDLLKLELWQKAMVSVIFGIVDACGVRVFREVFIVIARKNGKSLLASAILAYMAYMDDEYGAKLYCLAPKLELAEKVFDGFYQMVQMDEELEAEAKKRRSDIYIEGTNTSVKPLPFNAKKSEGFNPHAVICDEVAIWQGKNGIKQYETMRSAIGARKQPILLSITTAGDVNDGIYDELMKRSTAVLKKNSRERRLLPFLYMVDDKEKWDDMEELKKSNPNLGVSVPEEFYVEEINVARGSASKKVEFLMKYCNIKQNSSVAWLEYKVVDEADSEYTLEDFANCYAVAGIDLSQTTDLTAATVIIERGGVLYSFTRFFMPANKLEKAIATDAVPYDTFVSQGILILSGENYVNYRDVYDWFVALRMVYKIYILKIGYDRYMAKNLVDELALYGYHMDDVFQGENLAPVIREYEGILRDGNFRFGGHVEETGEKVKNTLIKAHFLNVALKHNLQTRKFRPVKIEERARIDGFVSVIDAMTVRQKYYNEIGVMLQNAA